ncbi:DUF5131 family protein [Streptomyces sp. NPDC058274]|uniref:DUF5131 family protein n=1 Tax=Streptomyces sp. NPDC058274 TaxID=3346416 RepID=UPI0036EEDFC6
MSRRGSRSASVSASVRFLLCESLLGPLTGLDLDGIDWAIVGGESGPGARPMDLAWASDIVERCRQSGTAAFVKQLGSCWNKTRHKDMARFSADLRVREYPHARDRAPA